MRIGAILLTLCVLGLFWQAAPVHAFTCNVTATGMNFGGYNIFAATALDSTATVSVTCNVPPQNPQAPLAVTVSLSTGNSGTFTQRALRSAGPGNLGYNLYTNASFSTIWGDGSGSSSVLSAFVHRDMPLNATIYGRVPAGQNVRAGSYSDTITVAIDY